MASVAPTLAAGTGQAWAGPTAGEQPGGGQRYSVALADGCALARPARTVRQLELGLSPLPALERVGGVGSRVHQSGGRDGRRRSPQHRQHHGARSCLGGRRKKGGDGQALGRSRGGWTSKLHCVADARGRPLAFHLTGGEAADSRSYLMLIGLPGHRPKALLADKGYDADAIRADLTKRRVKAVIPGRSNRTIPVQYDRNLYKERNRIERMIGHLKNNRALATHYDKLAASFLSMAQIAAIRLWLKYVHTA